MGQATGLFIYARNLYFINKQNEIHLDLKVLSKNIKLDKFNNIDLKYLFI